MENRVVDAYLHEGKIDRYTSQDQLARLREDHTFAEMELKRQELTNWTSKQL